MARVSERFAHLLANNDSLTALEVAAIRKEIATRCEALIHHQQEAGRLAAECPPYVALLAPLRRIEVPPEVLGTIFQLVVLYSPVDPMVQLQSLCLVCQAWRNVALLTPSLWVDLKVFTDQDTFDMTVVKIRERFARSNTIPKKLDWSNKSHAVSNPTFCPLHTPEFVDLLAEGPVLQELSLSCDSLQCFSTLITLVNNARLTDNAPWDSLSKLVLDGSWGWGGVNESSSPIEVLPRLPTSLSTLRVSLPYYDEVPGAIYDMLQPLTIPSIQVLELESDWPVPWIMKTLEGCRNVRTLELAYRGSGANNTGVHNLSTLTLPNIRNLRLRCLLSRYSNDTGILSFLVCPSIADLDISFQNDTENASTLNEDPNMQDSGLANNIAQFVTHSGCADSLYHFRLHSLKISSAGLIPVLEALGPSITHLTLEDMDIDPYICTLMADPFRLPCLEVLEFIHFPLTFEEGDFGYLVSARSPYQVNKMADTEAFRNAGLAKPSALKRAVLSHYTTRLFPPTRNWPQDLREKGVDCSMDLIWDR